MDGSDGSELAGRHQLAMLPGMVVEVSVHRDAARALSGVRVQAAGGILNSSDDLLSAPDSRELAEILLSAAVLSVGAEPARAPNHEMSTDGQSAEEAAEDGHTHGYLMETEAGSTIAVIVHLAHGDAPAPHHLPFLIVRAGEDVHSGLGIILTPAEADPLAASLLKAAAQAS